MSAILSTDDLNDFISPGIACIKPVETLPVPKSVDTFNSYEVTTEDKLPRSDLPPAQVSLTDCLACSGCVTSAEAVLVSLQSHSEILNALDYAPGIKFGGNTAGNRIVVDGFDKDGLIYVASVSPQTRASLAATYKVSEWVAGHMIEQLLSGPHGLRTGGKYGNGFEWVFDTNVAREACLVLGAEEVMASMAMKDGRLSPNKNDRSLSQPVKPVLTSSCPGWVCYAEKTHPYVLPHFSRIKSPQALMGTLLKSTLSRKLGIPPERIWHVAIMPCFDKKLEASREELTDAAWAESSGQKRGVRDVDCVITSKEILMLAHTRGINFAALPHEPISPNHYDTFPDLTLQKYLFPRGRRRPYNGKPGAGTSGGNLLFFLEYFSAQHNGSSIKTSRGRNSDVVEYSVISANGEILLTAARYYGFHNIQNLVRRLKPAKASRMPGSRPLDSVRKTRVALNGPEYAYIEVMACPGGCTNGGGQIKVDDPIFIEELSEAGIVQPLTQKEWLASVDEAYFSGEEIEGGSQEESYRLNEDHEIIDGISLSAVKSALAYWTEMIGVDLARLAYTSYRAVISDVGKDQVDHTKRVVELAGKMGGGW